MAVLTWLTSSGLLGTFSEEVAASITLEATKGNSANTLKYSLLNGDYPQSMNSSTQFTLSSAGVITFTAAKVDKDIRHNFTVRVTESTSTNVVVDFADRTFGVIITGIDAPAFTTLAGDLVPAGVPDSVYFTYQIQYYIDDPSVDVTVVLKSGSLPPGLYINNKGLIKGYPGITGSPLKAYAFTLQLVSDSGTSIRNFVINVTKNTFRKPVILNNKPLTEPTLSDSNYPYYTDGTGELTHTFQEDNFIYKILGKSFDNNPISYSYYGTFKLPITDTLAGADYLYCTNTGILSVNQGIEFIYPVVGGVEAQKVYYVSELISDKIFRISETIGGPPVKLTSSDTVMLADLKLPPGIYDNIKYSSNNTKITIIEQGTGYSVNDKVRILGNVLLGVNINNDLEITIKEVDSGKVVSFEMTSLYGINTNGLKEIEAVQPQNITGSGSGLKIDISIIGAEWLIGKFSNLPSIIDSYGITFVVKDEITGILSDPSDFSLVVVNRVQIASADTRLIWNTDPDLGIIKGGENSSFGISATALSGVELDYRILSPEVISTTSITNVLVCDNTAYLLHGQPIRFKKKFDPVTETYKPLIGDVVENKIYYVKDISDNITFTISETLNGELVELVDGTGNMIAEAMLPPSLKLLPTGEIIGKLDFQLSTVLAEKDAITLYQFTVEAYNVYYPEIKSSRVFNIQTVNTLAKPYENIYIKSFFPRKDKNRLREMLWDIDIFPKRNIYRKYDPFFGLSASVFYRHIVGLTVTEIEDYLDSINKNHYNKKMIFGPAEYAIARDPKGIILYEVIYSKIVDNFVNKNGESVSKEILWPYDIPDHVDTVYPNSTLNMRERIYSNIVSITDIGNLPLWMRTVQLDGSTLGLTPSWALCYVKPGYGKNTATKFNQKYKLNDFNFEIDRFIVDKSLTYNYNPVSEEYYSLPSSGVADNSKDQYVYFKQKTILK